MNTKNLFTAGLLLFVAAAFITIALRNRDDEQVPDIETRPIADGVVVYFFHGETRCPTCRKIETYAHEAIEDGFSAELASGKLSWQTANYEAAQNAEATEKYDVFSSSVVLVRNQQGEVADWRNLTRVWDLVDDQDAFRSYVRDEAREVMTGVSREIEE